MSKEAIRLSAIFNLAEEIYKEKKVIPWTEAIEEALAKQEQPTVRIGNCLRVGVCASEGHKIQAKQENLIPSNSTELEKQEPVAWMQDSIELYVQDRPSEYYTIPLYTHTQPKREPLTEREILDFWLARFDVEGSPINNFAREIEAAHGIIKTYPEKDKT